MKRDSIQNTFAVASVLCIVCSIVVSSVAVGFRPAQELNKKLDKRKNILLAAGLADKKTRMAEVKDLFAKVDVKLVDLATGEYVDSQSDPPVDPETYDQRAATRVPKLTVQIDQDKDVAGLKVREKYSFVYLIKEDGRISQIVLPVKGKGLWSTLYGFLSLDSDLKTVRGLTFYEHAETPGLGGEVDNQDWKDQWKGKQARSEDGKVLIEVMRGQVDESRPEASHQIDGLSGATITSRGVEGLIEYWLGEDGFRPYLTKLESELKSPGE